MIGLLWCEGEFIVFILYCKLQINLLIGGVVVVGEIVYDLVLMQVGFDVLQVSGFWYGFVVVELKWLVVGVFVYLLEINLCMWGFGYLMILVGFNILVLFVCMLVNDLDFGNYIFGRIFLYNVIWMMWIWMDVEIFV